MSDQPVTVAFLAQFHRDVILPDVERSVGALLDQRFDALNAHFDNMYRRFERLETEYEAIKLGFGRLEQRLDRMETEQRDLAAAVRQLDERLSRVEKRLDGVEKTP